MTELFRPKPWEFKGRRMERNAPSGTLCSVSPWCTNPRTIGFHCTVCHETFGGLSSFDKHRNNGWCINPADLELTLDPSGVWRRPQSDNMKATLALRAAAEDARNP